MPDDHDALINVAARWERINADQQAEIAELKRRVVYAETELERAQALISWIDGACVDEMPWLEIGAAIYRYWKWSRHG